MPGQGLLLRREAVEEGEHVVCEHLPVGTPHGLHALPGPAEVDAEIQRLWERVREHTLKFASER